MNLHSDSFADNSPIPAKYAFCKPDPAAHVAMSQNVSPHFRWSDAPAGTQSYVLICDDVDVPSIFDDVNQEGKTLPADLPRIDFYHWVLVDIPPSVTELAEGADADGVTPKGKPAGKMPYGTRGINDYTKFMAGNPDMAGDYGGYDGPCPPWNDERLHRYVFTVYALDVPSLGLAAGFTGEDALQAMEGHILAQASWTGTYTQNPAVKG
ncbi:MAG: YbhB/YbcL family Raf kinase inhibitor-like protein [Gammaproteobacteria bacterium]|nr:YbhB/YbcL family Raf kinase inhibitor-like protein [Gammaproteobacteria bacterium]NIR98816.1 YbhB/YbcL family Raf kinase inhibitor-like protein [Gammaproteobacteria bacterium]NIT64526.1 YbhB/YbcL family Raf kinase inhibitor-like protein [Gammaproteobacteria bacterium]NIV21446.1 YbhB/YbcL family Raf kinase inhibitor-like protein [Gammaproteobacteria bacterium]NIX11323.1 YbhB/YbcL family Raf kinase inhibitor-like protein [Gammaproteobacteria bacterium]